LRSWSGIVLIGIVTGSDGKMRKTKGDTKSNAMRQSAKFGMFLFFTGAGFLDLGFEDAGFVPMMAVGLSDAETQRKRDGMNEIATMNDEVEINGVRPLICELRGQAVMLDRDLASLYHVMTGRLNEAVKRNIARFLAEFMFQLSDAEMKELIASCDRSKTFSRTKARKAA